MRRTRGTNERLRIIAKHSRGYRHAPKEVLEQQKAIMRLRCGKHNVNGSAFVYGENMGRQMMARRTSGKNKYTRIAVIVGAQSKALAQLRMHTTLQGIVRHVLGATQGLDFIQNK